MDDMSIVDIYKLVLTGKLKKFPNYSWSEFSGIENAKLCIRYMIEKELNWNPEDIRRNIKASVFAKYKLRGMLYIVFNGSPFRALDATYPGVYKPWELTVSPMDTWDKDVAIFAFKWLIEQKLKWSEDDITKNLSIKTFQENGLGGMLFTIYANNVRDLLTDAYPEIESIDYFRVYESKTKKDANIKMKKEIETNLGKTKEEILENFSYKFFIDSGLENTLKKFYNQSPYNVLEELYPGKFMPWELKAVPEGYWSKDTAISAVAWTLSSKLNIPIDMWANLITAKWLKSHKLNKVLPYIKISELKKLAKQGKLLA